MLEYESLIYFIHFLKVLHYLKQYWFDNVEWQMAKIIYKIV